VTLPVALEGGQQLVHLGLGQMLPDPVGIIAPVTFAQLVALRTILACRGCRILPAISAPPDGQLIA
jgi:hypothetical protein